MSEQLPLFGNEHERGRQLRDEAMEHVEVGADYAIPDWSRDALDWVRRVAASNAQLTSESVMDAAYAAGFPAPPEPRAWGPVMRRAAMHGWIRRESFLESIHARAHCRPVTVWRSRLLHQEGLTQEPPIG